MLVRFSVENFLSFRDRTELSMVASRKVRRHPEHVIKPSTAAGIPLLKLAIIYGANASGKSNLIKAIELGKDLVLHPAEANGRIVHTPYKLDQECRNKPTRLEYEIRIDDRYFAYGLAFDAVRIEEEWLFELLGDSEEPIFERKRSKIELGRLPFAGEDEEQFLKFTAKGTLPNRLFLTECRERNVGEHVKGARDILNVLDWIENRLVVVLPAWNPVNLPYHIYTNEEFKKDLANYLKCFDTGISAIEFLRVELESVTMPDEMRRKFEAEVEAMTLACYFAPDGSYFMWDRDDRGSIRAWKLIARHSTGNGAENSPPFDLIEESDGTRRLMRLVPAMMSLMTSDPVFAIDELDRSLHPDILHSYLANFLEYSADRRSQLIVTTHDTTVLKQPFIRRDEVWFVEKGTDQCSRMVALEEYKDVEKSKDLQQDYLIGRFGGVPVIRDFSWLGEDHGKGT
jgi:AAA15 family ATPase/GTPase